MRPAHTNNRLNFLLLKLWLPPSFPTSKCFLLKKSHGSLLLKIKDNHIKIKVQAGASTERTLKSRLEFLLSWAPPRTPSGRPVFRMHAYIRLVSLVPLGSQTILTQRNWRWPSVEMKWERYNIFMDTTYSVLNIHWKDWCWSWNSNYFGHLMQRANSLEKTLMPGKIEGRRRGHSEMVGWHHWRDGHEFE